MIKYYMGIDPGRASGAYALISDDLNISIVGDYTDDITLILEQIHGLKTEGMIAHCALERLWGAPIRGSKANFSLGHNVGVWEAILAACDIPYSLVIPKKWQTEILGEATGKTKTASLDYARKRFPGASLTRKKDHNRADALCMALWAKHNSK